MNKFCDLLVYYLHFFFLLKFFELKLKTYFFRGTCRHEPEFSNNRRNHFEPSRWATFLLKNSFLTKKPGRYPPISGLGSPGKFSPLKFHQANNLKLSSAVFVCGRKTEYFFFLILLGHGLPNLSSANFTIFIKIFD